MPFSEEFYNAFIYSWNENADEYMKKTNMRFEYDLRVAYCDEGITKEVPRFSDDAIKIFYMVFRGSVCDSDHWEFFKKCFTYVYQKNGFIDDFNKNYSAFREYWDRHIDELNERLIGKYKGNHVIVVRGKSLSSYEIAPKYCQCFYKVFNGTVCDSDHWEYFKECLINAEKMTRNRR